MSTTPVLAITEFEEAQANPDIPINTATRTLEIAARGSVLSATTGTPPSTPSDGDAYIVPASGTTGAWVGKEKKIAWRMSTSWQYITPIAGLTFRAADSGKRYRYEGTSWVDDLPPIFLSSEDFDCAEFGTVAHPVLDATVNGTAAAVTKLSGAVSGALGVFDLATGTDNAGRAFVATRAMDATSFGDGVTIFRARVRLSALSDGTDTYAVRIGFQDSASNTAPTDGAWFAYTHGTNSGRWVGTTSSNSTTTSVNAATAAPAANTWSTLEIKANAGGTAVDFYIDGALIGSIATNIPANFASRVFGWGAGIVKSAGTTSRSLQLDFMSAEKTFTAARQYLA